MNKSTLIWAASAFVYLGVVIASYTMYTSLVPQKDEHLEHHAMGASDVIEASEVTTFIRYENDQLVIELHNNRDVSLKPQLEINHEQDMHLIVVSDDLQQYFHLHPQQKDATVYVQDIELADKHYKAFVDIKPQGLNYVVQPLDFLVGKGNEHEQQYEHEQQHEHGLALDEDPELTKVVNGQAVKLNRSVFAVNESVTLDFTIQDAVPEPYLGALGHVVILDEAAESYIHVHPLSDTLTKFSTTFNKPGLYKLWAEFKFNGTVNVYPFIIEVQTAQYT